MGRAPGQSLSSGHYCSRLWQTWCWRRWDDLEGSIMVPTNFRLGYTICWRIHMTSSAAAAVSALQLQEHFRNYGPQIFGAIYRTWFLMSPGATWCLAICKQVRTDIALQSNLRRQKSTLVQNRKEKRILDFFLCGFPRKDRNESCSRPAFASNVSILSWTFHCEHAEHKNW